MVRNNLSELAAFHDEEEGKVVIETPKGSRNKYNYDEKLQLFKLGGVLTSGAGFPFDFGFVPSTLGGGGGPLDGLVLVGGRRGRARWGRCPPMRLGLRALASGGQRRPARGVGAVGRACVHGLPRARAAR